jgi:hypothetical protein
MTQQRATRALPDRDTAFKTEHVLAYVLTVLSLVLGLIGALRGFGVIGGNDASNTANGNVSALWDGVVWLLPAISAALLAWSFHRSDHHRLRDPERLADPEEAAWKTEHLLANVLALASVIFALLGILVGFHLLGRGDHQYDSMPWHLLSIGSAILTNALHSVRHHQLAAENDFVVAPRREPTTADPAGRETFGDRTTNRPS